MSTSSGATVVRGPALFDLTGRRALVTGSSKGIGLALATGLAEAGAEVVLNGRDTAALERARGELAARTGTKVHAVAFDVTDEPAVRQALREIEDRIGTLDALVNNTGVQHREPLLQVSAETFERVVNTNLTSAFMVGRAVATGMVERGHGKIVNICSVQTWLARPGIAAYPDLLTPDEIAVYMGAYQQPGAVRGSSMDYRAAPQDAAQDREDADQLIDCPVLTMWGEDLSAVGQLYGFLDVWKGLARNVRGVPIPQRGHLCQEERPDVVNGELLDFLTGRDG
ncbi:SDR family NAD(P)-dependent oxidoreductase [Streptomyces sp. NPDC014995]|uniref:SDR family NAD(P)-dependent oxidoreductase n=1 Tax=Streptomyces sp. NPDC014995 TaxID=3364936 RepID=UPI0036FEED96